MDLFIKLPPMEWVPVCGCCGKAVYKNGKVNKLSLTGEQMCQHQRDENED
jgi:hypothetical protein